MVQYPGNPECWDYVFDFNICCNERLRAEDIMHFCWDERRTFDKCCFRAVPQGEGTGSGTYLAKLAHSASSNAKGVEEFLQLAHSILPDGQPVSDIVAGAFIPSKGGRLHIPWAFTCPPCATSRSNSSRSAWVVALEMWRTCRRRTTSGQASCSRRPGGFAMFC